MTALPSLVVLDVPFGSGIAPPGVGVTTGPVVVLLGGMIAAGVGLQLQIQL